ncbi:MAG: nuclear transport factor 2 family protein [Cryomorphaceae bacterium]
MKSIVLTLCVSVTSMTVNAQETQVLSGSRQEINKEIARNFYQDLWFTNNTENYAKYVADTYVVHDIGEDRNGATEPAITQKERADMFWANGTWDSKIDYQIADGDLVATRWQANYTPTTLLGRVFFGEGNIPIINVFRIQDGKIVEIWNHRHDIESNMTLKFTFQGLLIGLLIALIPTIIAFRLKKKLKLARQGANA